MKQIRYPFGDTYLTPREAQIVSLLRQAYPTKQIATLLGDTDSTIDTMINNVLRKARKNKRAQLIIIAMDAGFDANGFYKDIDLFKGIILNPLPPGSSPSNDRMVN